MGADPERPDSEVRPGAVRAVLVPMIVAGGLFAWMSALAGGRRAKRDRQAATGMPRAAIAVDTTIGDELRRAKDAAEAANAAKTRYLVAVSHEIRSPLNAIYGYAQLLEREGAIPPAEAGSVIRRSAEHLTNLVEGLLDISRIESGVLKLRQDIVRLPALLDHVVDMFRMQAAAKGLSLDYVVKGRLPLFVRTDEKRLRQILINLLSNAIKYTQEGGATLSITYRSQTALVEVTDTGIGIAAEDLERVFEPFERGSSPDAAMQPGIGLGLAITRALARILGGEVTLSSEPGRGSSFQLRMMLPEPMTVPAGASSCGRVTGYRGERKTLLVVDDDPAQVLVLQNLLRPLGFVVFAAMSGPEGLALAGRHAPDLVLLDIQMPGPSGWEVAERLRATCGGRLRIVIVSANAHESRAGDDDRSCHDAFVSKPVELDALLDTIARQLDLTWIVAGEEPADAGATDAGETGSSLPLPEASLPFLASLRHHVRTGHVRAIETVLADLEAEVPESAETAAEMRRLLGDFDLRSLARMLDDVG